jgi:uncharacterized protein DUF4154
MMQLENWITTPLSDLTGQNDLRSPLAKRSVTAPALKCHAHRVKGVVVVFDTGTAFQTAARLESPGEQRHVFRKRTHRALSATLVAVLLALTGTARGNVNDDTISEVVVKAAFLFNFAKFAEWPALQPGTPLMLCVLGDDGVGNALVETVRGQQINGHALEVLRPRRGDSWRPCHLLFIAGSEVWRVATELERVRALPILTVSDGRDFSKSGGLIEFFVENGKMRFAINVDTAERSGLRLSSRLLGLAKAVRDGR